MSFLLCLIVILSVLEVDLYLPSFPSIAQTFGVSEAIIQNSLSLYLLVFALAILKMGPLADRYGRKNILLLALFFDLVGTLVILWASSIQLFFIGRALQAIGGCAGSVISRILAKEISSRTLTWLFTSISIAIAFAPMTGGLIEEHFGWRANFFVLALFQSLLWLAIMKWIPTQMPAVTSKQGSLLQVLKMREFLYFGGMIAIAWSGFFVFVHGAPLLFMRHFHIPPSQFGWNFALIVTGMTVGTLLVQPLKKTRTFTQVCGWGVLLLGLGGVGLALTGSHLGCSFCTFLYLAGLGIILPLCQDQIGESNPKLISFSFSLLIFFQMLGAASAGYFLTFFTCPFALCYFILLLSSAVSMLFGWHVTERKMKRS